jgi:hypothetical protein
MPTVVLRTQGESNPKGLGNVPDRRKIASSRGIVLRTSRLFRVFCVGYPLCAPTFSTCYFPLPMDGASLTSWGARSEMAENQATRQSMLGKS